MDIDGQVEGNIPVGRGEESGLSGCGIKSEDWP